MVVWLIFKLVVERLYKKYSEQILKGEKKWVNFAYFFTLETTIKTHESIFGMILYCLLMQFSCLTFLNTVGVVSFILSVIVCTYITGIIYYIWSILNNHSI